MCRIGIKTKGKKQYTLVPNRFIDQYMSDANGSYLKVYFFLLRYLSDGQDFSMSELADRMDYAEKDILRALRYWEKKGVLEFTQDKEGNLLTLDLTDLTEEDAAKELPVSDFKRKAARPEPVCDTSCPPESLTEKVERTLQRPLASKKELDLLRFLYDELKFPEDLILYLYQYALERSGRTPAKNLNRYIETVAMEWNLAGIASLADLQQKNEPFKKAAELYRRVFSWREALNESQNAYLRKWVTDWSFSQEILEEAFRRAAQKPTSNCRYIDAILNKWHEGNVQTLEDVQTLDKAHEERVKNLENSQKTERLRPVGKRTAAPNQFNDFDQREYSKEDWAEIERIMLQN